MFGAHKIGAMIGPANMGCPLVQKNLQKTIKIVSVTSPKCMALIVMHVKIIT